MNPGFLRQENPNGIPHEHNDAVDAQAHWVCFATELQERNTARTGELLVDRNA